MIRELTDKQKRSIENIEKTIDLSSDEPMLPYRESDRQARLISDFLKKELDVVEVNKELDAMLLCKTFKTDGVKTIEDNQIPKSNSEGTDAKEKVV